VGPEVDDGRRGELVGLLAVRSVLSISGFMPFVFSAFISIIQSWRNIQGSAAPRPWGSVSRMVSPLIFEVAWVHVGSQLRRSPFSKVGASQVGAAQKRRVRCSTRLFGAPTALPGTLAGR
jgi:hypothetical protein